MTDMNVTMRLRGEAAGLKRAGQEGKKALDDMQGAAGKARSGLGGYSASADRAERSTGRLADRAREASNVIRTVIAAAAINQASRLADQYINIQSRLELVTKSEERYAAARDRSYEISQRTFTALESTATLYGRMQQATDTLGRSQADALRTTELINKTFQISGTEAATASAAIIQLSQGLSAGALRGDEFNSVMEGAPRLADALGESLGKTRGELREMAEQGQITADVIIDAILKQGDTIDAEFARLEVTAGRGWQNVVNAATRALGEISQATGATVTIGAGLQELAEFIETLPQRVEAFGEAWQRVAGESSDAVGAFFDLFGDRFGDTISAAIDELSIFPVSVRTAVTIVLGEWDKLLITMEEGWKALFVNLDGSWEAFKVALGQQVPLLRELLQPDFASVGQQPGDAQALAQIEAQAKARKESVDQAIEAALAERDAILLQLRAKRDLAEADRAGTIARRQNTAAGKENEAALKAQVRASEQMRKAQAEFTDTLMQMEASIAGPVQAAQIQYERTLRDLELRFEDGGIAALDYYRALEIVEEQHRRNTESAREQEDVFADAIRSEREAIEVLRQSGRAREQLVDQLEIESAIRQLTRGMTDEQIRAYQDEIATLADLIAERQRAARIDSARNTVFGGISNLFDSAAREVSSGASVWDAFRSAGTAAIQDIAGGFADLVRETGSFGAAVSKLTERGGAINELVGQIGVAVGTIAGGGGQGAQIGSSLGNAFGLALSQGNPIVGAIGSVLGGLLGGLFDGGPDSTRISIGSSVRRAEQNGRTDLGSLQVRTSGDQSPYSLDVLNAVTEFDRALASLLSDEQLSAVQARLARWTGVGETLEEVLIGRLDVVLEEFGPRIAGFVEDFSTDLQSRVQALGDILALDRLAQDADLVTDSLDSALTLITEFGFAGERVAETYQRIAQAALSMDTALVLMGVSLDGTREQIVRQAAELAEQAGSPERAQALWDAFFENFYTDGERALARLTQARSGAESEFADIGLNVADYLGPGGRDRFRAEFEAIFESLSAAQRVQYLEAAAALGLLTEAQAAYNATLGQQQDIVIELVEFQERAAESYAQTAEGIRSSLADLGASEFQRALAGIARQLRQNIDTLNRTAREAGLQAAAEQDLADAHTLAAAQAAQALAQLMDAGRQQAAELYGSALSDIDAQIAALQSSSAATSGSINRFGNAIRDVAEQADAATRLLIGDRSPLKDREKLDLALQALRTGQASADEVLEIADRLFASGSDYNRVFAEVQSIVSAAGRNPQGGDIIAGGGGGDPNAARMAQLQAERERLLQEQSQLQRFGQAQDLAQTVADIAGATGESIEDVFRSLVGDRATLADFAADLRLDSVEALDAYIAALQANSYDVADMAQQLRSVFNEHLDGLREIFGEQGRLRIDPGAPVKPVIDTQPVIDVYESTSGRQHIESPDSAEQTALLRDVRALLGALVDSLPAAAEDTADATAGVRDAVDALAVALSRDSGGYTGTGSRSARAKPLEAWR
jgi:tape measure domain-containing protein